MDTARGPLDGVRVIPQMANFSATPGGLRRAAPLIGEHTREVAAELDWARQNQAQENA